MGLTILCVTQRNLGTRNLGAFLKIDTFNALARKASGSGIGN